MPPAPYGLKMRVRSGEGTRCIGELPEVKKYVLLWFEPSKTHGLAAFLKLKMLPKHGFGCSGA